MSNASYGNRISLPLPTSGEVQWDGTLGDLLTAILDVLAAQVTQDGIEITSNWDMQGHSVVDLATLQLSAQADPGTANSSWFGTDGEFYIRDGSNRRVRLSSSGSLNFTVAGGIGGQYGASGAQVTFTSAGTVYTFTNPSGSYANLDCAAVHVHQGTTSNYVGLNVPANLGSTYNLTFPEGGLPAATSLVTVDHTGTLNYSRQLAIDSITGSLVTFQGSINAQQTGTFRVVHATRDILFDNTQRLMIPAVLGSTVDAVAASNGLGLNLGTGGALAVSLPVPLRVGDRIENYQVLVNKGSSSGKVSWQLHATSMAGNLISDATVGNCCTTLVTAGNYSLGSSSLGYTVQDNEMIWIQVNAGTASGDELIGAYVDYRRPTGSV